MFADIRQQGFIQRLSVSQLIFARAEAFYKKEMYEQSAAAFTLSLNLISNNAQLTQVEQTLLQENKYLILCNLASCLIQSKIYSQAGKIVDQLVKTYPNQSRPYKLRAMIIMMNTDSLDNQLACQYLSKALSLDPSEQNYSLDTLKLKKQKLQFKSSNWLKKLKQKKPIYAEDNSTHFKERIIRNSRKLWQRINKSVDSETDQAYEEDEKLAVPPEIKKIGEYIDKKGQQMLDILQKTKRLKEAEQFQKMLKRARKLKEKLEKISKFDFSRPKQKLLKLSQQLGLDLFSPQVQQEIKHIHRERMERLKNWIDRVFGGDIALKISLDDQVNVRKTQNTYALGSQPEIVESPSEQEVQSTEKENIISQAPIQTVRHTGSTKVYVYGRIYGIAGLVGIIVSIALMKVVQAI